MELMEDGTNIYKLIGPTLLLQDKVESLSNVNKRIQYISGELFVFMITVSMVLIKIQIITSNKSLHIM